MAKYHVNTVTGRPNLCRADPSKPNSRGCPYKNEDGSTVPHFDTKEEARTHAENILSATFKPLNTITKSFNKEKFLQPLEITKMSEIPKFSELGLTNESAEYLGSFYKGEIPETSAPEELVDNDFSGLKPGGLGLRLAQEAGSYANINKVVAKEIADVLPEDAVVLDLMAGKGFFAKALREQGIPTIATDNNSWKISENIENLDAMKSLEKYGKNSTHVLMSWVPYTSDLDLKIMREMQEKHPHLKLIWCGETEGGCCGSSDPDFWNDFETETFIKSYRPFNYVNDYIIIGNV